MTGQINVNKIAARTGNTITIDSGNKLTGTIVQMIQSNMTSRLLINSTSEVDVHTGTITPQFADSKIIVSSDIAMIGRNTDSIRFGLQRNIAGGSFSLLTEKGGYMDDPSYWHRSDLVFEFIDTPNTTSAVIYKIVQQQQSAYNTYYNYATNSAGFSSNNDGRSGITMYEIAQ
tara:strand:+ start:195 stop:713 length:519 start_codon:yes stop_codon:yes gene_type:complete